MSLDLGQFTAAGVVMGTPDYMAPEQAQDSRRADIRADIYSLGCTLYQLLTGRVSFPVATSVEKLIKHSMDEPEPLTKLRPGVPAGLRTVVGKMMAKRPADRYQTPAEVAQALAPFGAAPSSTPAIPPRRWLIAAGLAAALLVVALVVVTIRSRQGDVTIQTDDPSIEIVARPDGGVVLIRDTKTGQTWNLDTQNLNLGSADHADGLRIELDGRKPLILRRRDGRLVTITGPVPPTEPSAKNASGLPERFKNSLGMEFVLVPKGKAWLGGGNGQPGDVAVNMPHDFYLGVYEVTQEEWRQVTGLTPSYFSRTGGGKKKIKSLPDEEVKRLPVEMVSWDDVQLFLAELNKRTQEAGWAYRLPTQVEWEYACRGGPMATQFESAHDYYFAKPTNELDPTQANFKYDGSLKRTRKVGSYAPNALGLYDMHGNVWEWCADEAPQADGTVERVNRGGSWLYAAADCRAASTDSDPANHRGESLGLRVARLPAASVTHDKIQPRKPVGLPEVKKNGQNEPGHRNAKVGRQAPPLTRPILSVSGFMTGNVVADDDFHDPAHSLFKADKKRASGNSEEFTDGHFVMYFRGPGPGFIGTHPDEDEHDFVFQVSGRVVEPADGSWGVYLVGTPGERTFSVMVRGDGRVEVGPNGWTRGYAAPKAGPIPAPAGYRREHFNTLAVARVGRDVTVFLNGKQITKLALAEPLGICSCGLMGKQYGKNDVRVEYQRYTIWELPTPLALAGPEIPITLDASGKFTTNDELAAHDQLLDGDKRCKVFAVRFEQGKSYTIGMTSKALDAYLMLLDPDKRVLAVDDDSGGGSNAQIRLQAARSGTYRIVATCYQAGKLGNYVLLVQRKD